jgi:phosphotriesterase-related protein
MRPEAEHARLDDAGTHQHDFIGGRIMSDDGKVMTVRGPIDPGDVGACFTHEHILFDWGLTYWTEPESDEGRALADSPIRLDNRGILQRNPFVIKENFWQESVHDAAREVADFRAAGGGTLVEVTPLGQGRDPLGLRRVSELTGVHIVASTGYYIQAGHPDWLAGRSVDELAAVLVRDITEGIDGTGVRAGFMGDVGTTKAVSADEEKSLRAVARAHLQTGVAFGIHVDPSDQQAMRVIEILLEEGVSPDRMVMEHMDEQPDYDYHLRVAATGVYLEFDTWGSEFYYGPPYMVPEPRDIQRAECVRNLIDHGHVSQLLMAQDVWLRQLMKKYGGEGYDSFFRYGVPRLNQNGVTDADIRTMLVDNPARLLPVRM